MTKYHKLGSLGQQTLWLTVLSNLDVHGAALPLRAVGESLLSPFQLLVAPDGPWLVATQLQSLPDFTWHLPVPSHLPAKSDFKFPLSRRTGVLLD